MADGLPMARVKNQLVGKNVPNPLGLDPNLSTGRIDRIGRIRRINRRKGDRNGDDDLRKGMVIGAVIWIRSVMPFLTPIAIPVIPSKGGANASESQSKRDKCQSQLFHGFFRFISLKRTFLLIPKIYRFVKIVFYLTNIY